MSKKIKSQTTIFYILQPLDATEKTDYQLHLKPSDSEGYKDLNRWMHENLYRKLYYWNKVSSFYTIMKNGKATLEQLERHPLFLMVQGIPSEL